MADGERQGAPGQAAESPEVAALLAKLASVTSAIHATWADGGMAAGDTLIRWRDRLAQCSEAAAVLGWRADADHAALARERRRTAAMRAGLEQMREELNAAWHSLDGGNGFLEMAIDTLMELLAADAPGRPGGEGEGQDAK